MPPAKCASDTVTPITMRHRRHSVTHVLGILVLFLCINISSAGKLWSDVCTQSDTKSLPFCDMSKTHEERAKDYVSRVPLAQKGKMMINNGAPFDELHIPAYQVIACARLARCCRWQPICAYAAIVYTTSAPPKQSPDHVTAN